MIIVSVADARDDWKSPLATEPAVMRATGTDGQNTTVDPKPSEKFVAPTVAPTTGERSQILSFPVVSAEAKDDRVTNRSTPSKTVKRRKNTSSAVLAAPKIKCSREGSNLQPSASEARIRFCKNGFNAQLTKMLRRSMSFAR